jgi:hypothetical protein
VAVLSEILSVLLDTVAPFVVLLSVVGLLWPMFSPSSMYSERLFIYISYVGQLSRNLHFIRKNVLALFVVTQFPSF